MALLTPVDILDPKGRVAPALFPSDSSASLTIRIQSWLDEAYAKAAVAAITAGALQNEAAAEWVYWRAYSAVSDRLMGSAAKVSLTDQGSREYTAGQLSHFAKLRDAAMLAYQELVKDPKATINTGKQGGVVVNSYRW